MTQGFLYRNAINVAAVLNGAGSVVEQFVYGTRANVPDYLIYAGGDYRIVSDLVGSPRAIVNAATGVVVETMSYDEFGNETEAVTSSAPSGYPALPFGFAGGLYDPATGLVRFGARDYDATIGRWTSKDPIRFRGAQSNIYVYVGNDPVNTTDMRGTAPFCNWSSQPVLVGGGTGPGHGHSEGGGFGTAYIAPGQCVSADEPVQTSAGPLSDVDVVDWNGDGRADPPMSAWDTWPLGEKVLGGDTGLVVAAVNNPLASSLLGQVLSSTLINPIIPIACGYVR